MVKKNVSLSEYTTFRIGGPADFFAEPESVDKLREALLNSVQPVLLGGGSNVLFPDEGYRGTIVSTRKLTRLELRGGVIFAECGVRLSTLANFACENGLTGLEFAAGIPGTVGGGIVMNAGAYGGETSQVVSKVTVNRTEYGADEIEWGYRRFKAPEDGAVVSAEFALKPGDVSEIRAKMNGLNARRREKQPLELPSAGSVFKRPEGMFAGKLIEDAGLKGFKIGGAAVSEKHAGFIVNAGGASCADVVKLIEHIQKTVLEKFGVGLEREIKIVWN